MVARLQSSNISVGNLQVGKGASALARAPAWLRALNLQETPLERICRVYLNCDLEV